MSKYANILIKRCAGLNTVAFRSYHNVGRVGSGVKRAAIAAPYGTPAVLIPRLHNNVANPVVCWKCGIERQDIRELFCEQCSTVQNPRQTENYFKLFDIEETFDVDQKALTQKYRQLQNILHPDKFSNKSEAERRISADFSSLLNKAYRTLQTPLGRAMHLLQLHGESVNEDQKVDDPNFLTEIMELNEEVEDADTPEKLKSLNRKNRDVLERICGELDGCFSNGDIGRAKSCVIKMKYFGSIEKRINSIMREKGIVD